MSGDPHLISVPSLGIATHEDQGGGPIRIRRGEQDGHVAALRVPEQRRAFRADGVHHRADVVHPLFERWQLIERHRVREPRSSLVEDDQPRERRESLQEARVIGLVPHELDIRDPARHVHEVERSLADHLVRDADVAAARVPGLRTLHVATRSPVRAGGA